MVTPMLNWEDIAVVGTIVLIAVGAYAIKPVAVFQVVTAQPSNLQESDKTRVSQVVILARNSMQIHSFRLKKYYPLDN